MKKSALSLTLIIALAQLSAFAGNWTHWRGPTGNSSSPDATPPVQWDGTKNVKWKTAIAGRGSGSPIIWENKVFVVTSVEAKSPAAAQAQRPSTEPEGGRSRGGRGRGEGASTKKHAFKLICIDRKSGKVLWEKTATETTPHQGTHSTHAYASASPCTDGKHVYAFFGSRGLFCYTLDGELKWKREDFGKMNTRNSFGEGSSPTLAGNKLLVPWDHEGPSALYALDKRTGKTIWKTDRDEPTNWSTPLVVDHKGTKQVILNGQTCARGYDLESGKELWRCAGQTQRPVASAVAVDDLVVVGSGFRGSFMGAFNLSGRGDIENTKNVAWTIERDTPDIASPALSNGRLYFHKGKSGMISCVDAVTGKPYYTAERIDGISSVYASPVVAGGHVYLTGRRGTTVVLKDGPKLEVVATNTLSEGIDATLAPVDNQLFIRAESHLYCIEQ